MFRVGPFLMCFFFLSPYTPVIGGLGGLTEVPEITPVVLRNPGVFHFCLQRDDTTHLTITNEGARPSSVLVGLGIVGRRPISSTSDVINMMGF